MIRRVRLRPAKSRRDLSKGSAHIRAFAAVLSYSIALCIHTVSAHAQSHALGGASVVRVQDATLSARHKAALAEFIDKAEYYGAFSISSKGAFAWVTGLNSRRAAETLAMHRCERTGAQCFVYAAVVPKPGPRQSKFLEGLAQSEAQKVARWLRTSGATSQSRALATSGYWGWSTTTRNHNVLVARRDALTRCQERLDERASSWLQPDEIEALRDAGSFDCEIRYSKRGAG